MTFAKMPDGCMITPGTRNDFAFVRDVFAKTGVLLSPGSGFGVHGRGYCRTSLVAPDAQIAKVMGLLEGAGFDWSR